MAKKILNVPYRSQWAEDAVSHNADCGPTCVSMILNYYGIGTTPDQGYTILANQFDRHFGAEDYTFTTDLNNLLNHKGVRAAFTSFGNRDVALAVLKQRINEGKPFIILVNYRPWQRLTGNVFDGSHFVVVTGYDDSHIYIHDPLFGVDELDEATGFKMSYNDFAAGWGGFNNPRINPDWHLIFPLQAPPDKVEKPKDPVVTPPNNTGGSDQNTGDTGDGGTTDPPGAGEGSNNQPDQTIEITEAVERRINALVAWHGESIDWQNRDETLAWADHLSTFGESFARHQVKVGESLSVISAHYYGRQDKWRTIMAFNQMRFEWANAGQWLRIPLLGSGSAHQTRPGNLPPKIAAMSSRGMAESAVFSESDREAENYKIMAPHSAGIGMVETTTVDDAKAAGFASEPDVTSNEFKSGATFKAIWTFENSGSTLWDDGYRLAHVPKTRDHTGGIATAQMAAKTSFTLAEIGDKDLVLPGDTVTVTVELTAPQANEVVATHWQLQNSAGENFGPLRWISAEIVPGDEPITPIKPDPDPEDNDDIHQVFIPIVGSPKPKEPSAVYGMNINPNLDSGDPREIDFRDVDINNQRGLGWVRYAYWASRNRRSGKEAYVKRYGQLIKTYADAGIKTLLVLHQDAFWGNGPWDHGGWGVYAAEFARECAEIAKACTPFSDMVAYQIFNETDSGWGDDAANPNKSAIGLPPDKYGLILQAASSAIRTVDAKATIVAGGMKTGPHNAVNYLKAVQTSLRKPLPVDALAYHPYGRRAQSQFDFVPFGTLKDAFKPFKESFPNLPIWLTEIGVPGHDRVFPPDRYSDISTFMDEAIQEFNEIHAEQVPVIIWFAWSDFSENSGIVTKDGRFKSGIKESFDKMKNVS